MGEAAPAVAVISQVRAGHIDAYHRLYVERFGSQGCRVASLPPARSRWLDRLARQLDRNGWLRGWRAWHGAAQSVSAWERRHRERVRAAFFIYLDQGFLSASFSPQRVERVFPRPWSGVVTGPAAVRGPVGAFAGRERVLIARNCRAVVVTDPAFVECCAVAWPGRRVVTMPEIADLAPPVASAAVQRLRHFAGGRRLVGLLGVVSAKKNVAAFLELARRAERESPGLAFFIAGDFTAAVCPAPERQALAAVLARRPANCWLHPEPIPDGAEFNAWIAACDAVWLAYRDVVYKSNVLTKAAHFAKPVLVSPQGVMAEHTARYRLGEVIEPADATAALAALHRLLASRQEGRRFREFAELNSIARLDETVAAVRRLLGL